MATTNYWLDIKVGQLLILIFIGIFSILGIALIFGGLALIFKKIQSLLNINDNNIELIKPINKTIS